MGWLCGGGGVTWGGKGGGEGQEHLELQGFICTASAVNIKL